MGFPEQEKKKTYSYQKVRTSLEDRTLDSMFPVRKLTQIQDHGTSTKGKEKASAEGTPARLRDVKESECILTSVKTLRQNVAKMRHRREYLVARSWLMNSTYMCLCFVF